MQNNTVFKRLVTAGALALAFAGAHAAPSGVLITEWAYDGAGTGGEFVEFTNFGPTEVDFNGWSFDDNSRTPGSFSLSALGEVASGQSVILSESSAADFRTAWGLSSSVKVIGGNTNNLGRADEINLYNGNTLVDRLTYGDQAIPGTVRTQNVSGRAGTVSVLGNADNTTDATGWVLSVVGDADHSYKSLSGNIGSPGFSNYAVAAVPEPESYALMLAGLGLIATMVRRRRR